MKVLHSHIDESVNFVEDALTGFIEARYVRREEDYFIAYLSSQTGCNRGCQFCHLTASRQTKFDEVDFAGFVDQAKTIFQHYRADRPAKTVHFNFMARGEPLMNPWIRQNSAGLLMRLGEMATDNGLHPKFNISTIMPSDTPRPFPRKKLAQMFPIVTPTIYYSLYSVNPEWRRKWLPAAMPVEQALDELAEYQNLSKKIVKLHGAFIAGENDSEVDVLRMMEAVTASGLRAEFNIVRYNPFDAAQGVESPHIERIAAQIGHFMPIKTITRVGPDVAASCGQFVGQSGQIEVAA